MGGNKLQAKVEGSSANGNIPSEKDAPLAVHVTKTRKLGWKTFLWDSLDKSPEEKKFLGKLDACLMTYAALSYFSKYLSQQNYTNAYVSGMKEELGFVGDQYNYIISVWTVGYVIGQIPSQLILTKVRPSIWLPACELVWTVLTFASAGVKNVNALYALRFFIGLAESSTYPGFQYVVGSWYGKEELAKRSMLWHTMSAIGPMFSGFLQAAAHKGLNGTHGLSGWRWLFIVDGVITGPIAILGFFIMPDLPSNTKPSWLFSASEIAIGQKRMELIGRKPPGKLTRRTFWDTIKNKYFWLLVPLYIVFNNSGNAGQAFIFWLKAAGKPGTIATKYTVEQINLYPLGQQAIQVVFTFVYAFWSDAVRKRWPPIVFGGLLSFVVCTILAATPVWTNIPRRWAMYYLSTAFGGISGLIMGWASELLTESSEARAITIGSMNMFAYVFQAWLPLLIAPQTQQPKVLRANITTAIFGLLMVALALVTYYFQRRDTRLKIVSGEADSETSTGGGSPADSIKDVAFVDEEEVERQQRLRAV